MNPIKRGSQPITPVDASAASVTEQTPVTAHKREQAQFARLANGAGFDKHHCDPTSRRGERSEEGGDASARDFKASVASQGDTGHQFAALIRKRWGTDVLVSDQAVKSASHPTVWPSVTQPGQFGLYIPETNKRHLLPDLAHVEAKLKQYGVLSQSQKHLEREVAKRLKGQVLLSSPSDALDASPRIWQSRSDPGSLGLHLPGAAQPKRVSDLEEAEQVLAEHGIMSAKHTLSRKLGERLGPNVCVVTHWVPGSSKPVVWLSLSKPGYFGLQLPGASKPLLMRSLDEVRARLKWEGLLDTEPSAREVSAHAKQAPPHRVANAAVAQSGGVSTLNADSAGEFAHQLAQRWGVSDNFVRVVVDMFSDIGVKYTAMPVEPSKIYLNRSMDRQFVDEAVGKLGNNPHMVASIADHYESREERSLGGMRMQKPVNKELLRIAPQGGINFLLSAAPERSPYGADAVDRIDVVSTLQDVIDAKGRIFRDVSARIVGALAVVLPENGTINFKPLQSFKPRRRAGRRNQV